MAKIDEDDIGATLIQPANRTAKYQRIGTYSSQDYRIITNNSYDRMELNRGWRRFDGWFNELNLSVGQPILKSGQTKGHGHC